MKRGWNVIEKGYNYSIEKCDDPIWRHKLPSYYRLVIDGRVVKYCRYFDQARDALNRERRKK